MSDVYHQQPTRTPKIHYEIRDKRKGRKKLMCNKSRMFKTTTDIDKVTCEECKRVMIEKGFIEVVENE